MRRIYKDPRTGKVYKKKPKGSYLPNGLHVRFMEELMVPEDIPFRKVMPRDRIVPVVEVDNSDIKKVVPEKKLIRKEVIHIESLQIPDRIVSNLLKAGVVYKNELESRLERGDLTEIDGIGKTSLSIIKAVLSKK